MTRPPHRYSYQAMYPRDSNRFNKITRFDTITILFYFPESNDDSKTAEMKLISFTSDALCTRGRFPQ